MVDGRNWLDDKAPRLGAALAFYIALSLAPTLVILLAIAGLVFSARASENRLTLEVQSLVGREGAVVQAMIEGVHRPRSGVAAILLGLAPPLYRLLGCGQRVEGRPEHHLEGS